MLSGLRRLWRRSRTSRVRSTYNGYGRVGAVMRIFKTRLRPIWLSVPIAILAGACWVVFFPHLYENGTAQSAGDAKSHCPIALPSSATNVRIATLYHFQQFA